MIKAFKLLWSKYNVAHELIAIIDGLQKENETLKEQALVFRNRAQSAEEELQKRIQRDTDAAIKRPLGITG